MCDTSGFGSQAHLNDLADEDIEIYKKQIMQLELELQRRKSIKEGENIMTPANGHGHK